MHFEHAEIGGDLVLGRNSMQFFGLPQFYVAVVVL